MAVLERRLPRPDSFFLRFAADQRSQGGEDGVLREVFRLLGAGAGPRHCVDVGAWDGEWLSNTYALLHDSSSTENHWSGLLIEANAQRLEQARRLYASNPRVVCECSLVSFEGASSLGSLLSRHEVAADFDFLSLDIDGADYHIWASLPDSHFRPKVVCIEFNPSIPNDVIFIQERSMHVHQGSSLRALIELASSMRYTLIVTTTFNAIFIANELMHLLPSFDNSIDKLHVPSMSTEMFQTYDGELKFIGCMKLLWHKMPINTEKLQILKRKDRKYPFAPPSSLSLASLQALCSSLKTINFAEDNLSFESIAKSALAELYNISGISCLRGNFIQGMQIVIDIIEEGLRSAESATQDLQIICANVGELLLSQAFHILYGRALTETDAFLSQGLAVSCLSVATSATRLKLLRSCSTFHIFRLKSIKMLCLLCRRERELFHSKYWLTVMEESLCLESTRDASIVEEFERFVTSEKVKISSLLFSNLIDSREEQPIASMNDAEDGANEINGNYNSRSSDAMVDKGSGSCSDRGWGEMIHRLESEREEAFICAKIAGIICLCSVAATISLILRLRSLPK